jgi:hypothetical protein
MLMRLRLGGIVAAIAATAAIVAGASAVLADEAQEGPGHVPAPGELTEVTAQPVDAPGGGQPQALARAAGKRPPKPKKPTLVYLETEPQVVNPGPTGFRVTACPPKAKAINGYYYVNGVQTGFGLTNQGDSPIRGLREWAFYLDGGAAGANGVTFGLICLKNVKS